MAIAVGHCWFSLSLLRSWPLVVVAEFASIGSRWWWFIIIVIKTVTSNLGLLCCGVIVEVVMGGVGWTVKQA